MIDCLCTRPQAFFQVFCTLGTQSQVNLLPLCITLLHLSSAGALGTLLDGKLFAISGAQGSPKFDQLESLDLFALANSYSFSERMRAEVVGLLQGLETWAEKQASGMELAAQPDALASNFDSLLKVSGCCCASLRARIWRACARRCSFWGPRGCICRGNF